MKKKNQIYIYIIYLFIFKIYFGWVGRGWFSYNVYFPLVSYVQTVCQVCGLDAMKAETWNSCEPKFLRILWAEVASFSHSSFV
jgi:hypothetical protein